MCTLEEKNELQQAYSSNQQPIGEFLLAFSYFSPS